MKKTRCLVIQMARLGDSIQSLMALRAAKQLYPGLEIHFLVREKYADAARRIPWLDSVFTFPTDKIVGPQLNGSRSDRMGMADVAQWLNPLIEEPWDILLNWSYSKSSSYLATLIPAVIKLGYVRNMQDAIQCADAWSTYFQGIIQGGIPQNIHLTDILTTQLLTALQLHLGEPEDSGNAPVTSKEFFKISAEAAGRLDLGASHRKWIGIQLGAGRSDKTWEAEKWAKLARLVLSDHPQFGIVLLGGREDQGRAAEFIGSLSSEQTGRDRIVSLVGETDFDLWTAAVARCQWVMAGDTSVIHLASVLGTRVLNLSLGPVRWSETGPYGNGHYVIDPKDDGELSPEFVYGVWEYAMTEWSHRRARPLGDYLATLGYGNHIEEASVYRAKIRPTSDGGGVYYEPILCGPMDLDEWCASVMGHVARAWYCGWLPKVGQELKRTRISPKLLQDLRMLEEPVEALHKVLKQAVISATQLAESSSKLKSDRLMDLEERKRIQSIGKRLTDLDALVERLGGLNSPLLAFSHMLKVMMHNLRGTRIAELGQESAEAYASLSDGVEVLRIWIEHTVSMVKPVAIEPGKEAEL